MRLFSHSAMRWLAVRLKAFGPRLDSAGHGIGSLLMKSEDLLLRTLELFSPLRIASAFTGVSVLILGLLTSDTVDGRVADSDALLELREACGLLAMSHASHVSLSLDVIEDTLDGDFVCRAAAPAFLTVAGEAF